MAYRDNLTVGTKKHKDFAGRSHTSVPNIQEYGMRTCGEYCVPELEEAYRDDSLRAMGYQTGKI